jgi:Domain of unknown function (DUF4160)
MPTVLREGAYRFYFYSHEPNEPPHIHIDRDNLTVKFWLEPINLAKNIGFREKELKKIEAIVEENKELFWESWHEYFSNSDERES